MGKPIKQDQSVLHVFIVEDHAIMRDGLKRLLKDEGKMEVVGEAADAGEVVEKVKHAQPDIVLLDISLPGKSGLEVLQDLKRQITTPILILTMHPEKRYAVRAIKAGASGYVTKDAAPTELIRAIHTVVGGEKYVSQALSQELILQLATQATGYPHESLTDREYEVFLRLASGKSTHEIAKELGVSEATIYTHREHILEKMKVKSIPELTSYAFQNDLLE